ncbi:DUF3017 domain-containing protein [Haloactinomyces albus]|uniref:DUF3017 family protein n=1 Tax=Haloactinomyces albus TaxID=1352928 RepID=A0AAE3ZF28_9ACTN|nr:DUF3017 domain-containing protein [Haloactinomyces albus]MDR7302600.1 hypothetical protein [Haloactinomyces albus]
MADRFRGGARLSVHLPFSAVVLVALSGLVWVGMQHWREGAALLGGALLLAAALRTVVSTERVGLLAIRSRTVDILLYAGLGLLIVFIAVTIKGGPLAT